MLERASSCFESGGRHVLKGRKCSARSHRLIHSSFWHHGATDLKLPIWWAFVPPSPSDTRSESHNDNKKPAGTRDASIGGKGGALEFLYPAKTWALMQRLSTFSWDTWSTRASHGFPRSLRQFSSASIRPFSFRDRPILDDDPEESDQAKSIAQRYSQADPSGALRHLLETDQKYDPELAWQLYEQMDKGDREPQLQADLLDYLGTSPRQEDAGRTLTLFEALPKESKGNWSYRAAIGALLRLQMAGQALVLHTEAARQFSKDFGTDLLLGRLVFDRQWGLAFRVFETYTDSTEAERIDNLPGIWSMAERIPNLSELVVSLLEYERESQNLRNFPSKAPKWREFIAHLIDTTVQNPRQESRDVYVRFFQVLHEVGLAKRQHWEDAIGKLLMDPNVSAYRTGGTLYVMLYQQYARLAKERQDQYFRPSPELLELLLRRLMKYKESSKRRRRPAKRYNVTVESVAEDWETFYGADTIPARVLNLIAGHFAFLGQQEKVSFYFDKLRNSPVLKGRLVTSHIRPLLLVHARQADVEKTFEQFQRINKEFGLEPDNECWSLLIQAHARASDLEGALGRFHEMIEAGYQPDQGIFGPLLHLHSQRGDVGAVKELVKLAQSLGAPINKVVAAYWQLVAHVQADDIKAGEEVATALLETAKENGWRGLHVTKAWNTLLTYYSYHEDIESVMRLYQQMQKERILMDKWAYAAILRSLCVARQTDRAYKILRKGMPRDNVEVLPMHYAIIMMGYSRQRQPAKALKAHQHMARRGMAETISTRIAYLEAMSRHHKRNTRFKTVKDAEGVLRKFESDLQSFVAEHDPAEIAEHKSTFAGVTPVNQALSEAYLVSLFNAYGSQGVSDVVDQLTERYFTGQGAATGLMNAPFRLLTGLMKLLQSTGRVQEVESLWQLIRKQASTISSTKRSELFPEEQKIRLPVIEATEGSKTGSLKAGNTPAVSARHDERGQKQREPARIPPALLRILEAQETTLSGDGPSIMMLRRRILTAPLNIYLQTLVKSERYDDIKVLVDELAQEGYAFDNNVWNLYVEVLTRSGHIDLAFQHCEERLIDNFPGWVEEVRTFDRNSWPAYAGFAYMNVKRSMLKRTSWLLMPTYRTLVILAAAIVHVRKTAAQRRASGREIGEGNVDGKGFDSDSLARMAPKTMGAVESMPLIKGDELQKEFLQGGV